MSSPCVSEIKTLISQGKIEPAIDKFLECSKDNSSLHSSVVLISSQFKQLKREYSIGVLDRRDYASSNNRITYSLLGLADELAVEDSSSDGLSGGQPSTQPKAFISYNREDMAMAIKVQRSLEDAGITVIIDEGNDQIGRELASFIAESIQNSDCTVSIVSEKSLLSTWVASETLLTFVYEQVNGGNQFFPVYLDKSFFEPEFILTMVDKIDEDIDKRQQTRAKLMARNVNATNLTVEIDRLHQLRQNAGKILERLTGSLSLDIRKNAYEENIQKLITAIRRAAKQAD